MSKAYRVEAGSVQHKFQQSRAKVQLMGGGFANGKTTSAIVKAINLAVDYPGSNGLLGRASYAKIEDSIKPAFYQWCPADWIAYTHEGKNYVQLTNGSRINFRYVHQKKGEGVSSSNLLSATYDWAVVDQIEDAEIEEKDFDDLLGRLRGTTKYMGTDETMPSDGPRWLILTCNPARNWVYRRLVKPYHDYLKGIYNPNLITDDDGKCLIEIFEGSTLTNKANLSEDFYKTLIGTYSGAMKARYIDGLWGAFEGLVYPQFIEDTHCLDRSVIEEYIETMHFAGWKIPFIESYDYGMAVPSCYLFAFSDNYGNIFILDGYYEKECHVDDQVQMIKDIRKKYSSGPFKPIYADPAIFRRSASADTVGESVANMFLKRGISMQRGNNNVLNGIAKVSRYLIPREFHKHPINGVGGSPHLFVNKELHWFITEITNYMWKQQGAGFVDIPNDKNDHAMDSLKYLLSYQPDLAAKPATRKSLLDEINSDRWGFIESKTKDTRSYRHGR